MAEIRIFRFDPDRNIEPHFDKFHLTIPKGSTVADVLCSIQEDHDPSLAFRGNCGSGSCGDCALHINGKTRLACATRVEALENWEVEVRPLAHFPVIRDLVTDLHAFFNNVRKVEPWLQPSTSIPDKEWKVSPEQTAALGEALDCIWCGACFAACPITSFNDEYLGPQAFLMADRFLSDPRDENMAGRMEMVDGEQGVARCHSIFNCQSSCPKGLDPAAPIGKLRRKLAWQGVRKMVGV